MKTPQESYHGLAEILGVPELYFKREDLHKYGSHKGRSIPHMIKTYFKKDNTAHFVISSSGNAALAAARFINQHNKNNPETPIELTIYVGKKINVDKLTAIQAARDAHIHIEQVDRPKQQAFLKEKSGEAINLRQSTDDLALEGYAELADELCKIPNLTAVFIPTSSGTTALALAQIFAKNNTHIQIHVVQTTACHPIADAFDTTDSGDRSIAGAIVDNIAHRKQSVLDAIRKSNGSGWINTNAEIEEARTLVKNTVHVTLSPNSALAVAGLTKAIKNGWSTDGAVACIITGA